MAVLEELAVQATDHRNCLPVAMQATSGSITRSIAAERPMEIVEPRTDLVVQLGETHWPIVKPAQGSKLAERAAIYPAIERQEAVWAIGQEDVAEAIEREDVAEAIEQEDLAEAEQVREAGIVREAAGVETGVHLVVDPEGLADQAHAPAATEVLPAWDLEVAVAAVAAVEGGGRHERRTQEHCDETDVHG